MTREKIIIFFFVKLFLSLNGRSTNLHEKKEIKKIRNIAKKLCKKVGFENNKCFKKEHTG